MEVLDLPVVGNSSGRARETREIPWLTVVLERGIPGKRQIYFEMCTSVLRC